MSQNIKIALLMAVSLFMEMLDGTIVVTALPSITKYFSTTSSYASLLVSVYLVSVALFIPISGWIANYIGKKRTWLIAVIIFTLSSLGSALAPTISILLFMRVLQGISGALMTPTARLIVLEKAPFNQLLKLTSYLVWPALVAPAIAPFIGGFIVTLLSWHWIFIINLPLGLFAIIIGYKILPTDSEFKRSKFDWIGFLEVSLASILVVLGAEISTRNTLAFELLGLSLILLGALMLIPIYIHLKNSNNPLFSLAPLKAPLKLTSYRLGQTSGSILWLSVGAMPYFLTIYLQNIFHWSPVVAGGYVFFIFLGNIAIKPFTIRIIQRLLYRGSLIMSYLIIFLSAISLYFITKSTPGYLIAGIAFASGVGRSMALSSFNGLTFSEVEPSARNNANTLNAVTSSLAQGLGISFISLTVHLMISFTSNDIAYRLGFVILGLLMIYPIVEILKASKIIGQNTL